MAYAADALIDTGADNTLLPYSLAEELGVAQELVTVSEKRHGPGGATFRTMRLDDPMDAQLVDFSEGQPTLIGPTIPIHPEFIKPPRWRRRKAGTASISVLGRDFQDPFELTCDATNRVLALTWPS